MTWNLQQNQFNTNFHRKSALVTIKVFPKWHLLGEMTEMHFHFVNFNKAWEKECEHGNSKCAEKHHHHHRRHPWDWFRMVGLNVLLLSVCGFWNFSFCTNCLSHHHFQANRFKPRHLRFIRLYSKSRLEIVIEPMPLL